LTINQIPRTTNEIKLPAIGDLIIGLT